MDRESLYADPAVRFWIRERIVSLVVYNHVTEQRTTSPSGEYWEAADDVLREWYPAYRVEERPLARSEMAPDLAAACAGGPSAAVLIFPGVVRLTDRKDRKSVA